MRFVIAIILVAAWGWWALGYHIVYQPTPDQLYGCAVEQQAPNGDCK